MAGQLPRPWSFRLGSMTRPTTAPVTDQPRPVPARIIRPPIIRPAVVTEPEPTTPKESAKSPPQLPRPAASLTPPVKKEPSPPPAAVPSPPSTASTTPVVPSPPATVLTRPVVPSPSATAALTRPVVPSPPAAGLTMPVVPSPSIGQSGGAGAEKPGSSPKGSSSVAGSPGSIKEGSPVQSPSLIPKSIPAVPSPYMSPKPKVATSPPSPLVLPPPQLKSVAVPDHESIPQEVERKTVVFQKVMEKPPAANQEQNGKQEAKKLHYENQEKVKGINGTRKGTLVQSDVDKDSNTRVITMVGENRGAFMEVVMSDKNNNARHLQIRQSNNNVNETENEDNKSKKKSIGSRNNVALPMKGFFNSNVQGINNSILMDSKFAHHDPGIHLRLSRMPSADKEADQELQH